MQTSFGLVNGTVQPRQLIQHSDGTWSCNGGNYPTLPMQYPSPQSGPSTLTAGVSNTIPVLTSGPAVVALQKQFELIQCNGIGPSGGIYPTLPMQYPSPQNGPSWLTLSAPNPSPVLPSPSAAVAPQQQFEPIQRNGTGSSGGIYPMLPKQYPSPQNGPSLTQGVSSPTRSPVLPTPTVVAPQQPAGQFEPIRNRTESGAINYPASLLLPNPTTNKNGTALTPGATAVTPNPVQSRPQATAVAPQQAKRYKFDKLTLCYVVLCREGHYPHNNLEILARYPALFRKALEGCPEETIARLQQEYCPPELQDPSTEQVIKEAEEMMEKWGWSIGEQ